MSGYSASLGVLDDHRPASGGDRERAPYRLHRHVERAPVSTGAIAPGPERERDASKERIDRAAGGSARADRARRGRSSELGKKRWKSGGAT